MHLAIFQKLAQAADDLASVLLGLDDVAEDFRQLRAVDLGAGEETQRRLGIAEDGGEGLVQLVGERTGELAEHGHAREMGQFRAHFLHLPLGLLARCDHGAHVGRLDHAGAALFYGDPGFHIGAAATTDTGSPSRSI